MNLINQIQSCGILDMTSQSTNKKFGAPTPSRFVYKQVNAQPN